MKCEDCRGTGRYVGMQVIEDCKRCHGSGVTREFKVGQEHIDKFVIDYDLKPAIKLGTVIDVYDYGEWTKAEVNQIYSSSSRFYGFVDVTSGNHSYFIKFDKIYWHDANQRYEHVTL